MRSRLEVWAGDPAEAVLWAGGLICDRALDGWDVVVLLPDRSAGHALKILGATVDSHESHPRPTGLTGPMLTISAASGDPDQEPYVRSYVCGLFEPVGHGFRHRLSAGARAFKSYALRAAGLETEVAAAEMFRTTKLRPLTVAHGRIDRWPNAGQRNDASSTPGACC